jgi:hypothetical protein
MVEPSFKAMNLFALKVLTQPFISTSELTKSCDSNSETVRVFISIKIYDAKILVSCFKNEIVDFKKSILLGIWNLVLGISICLEYTLTCFGRQGSIFNPAE